MGFIYFVIRPYNRARFGSTYTKIGTIQRRLAWPLRKDDTQIREAFHIFVLRGLPGCTVSFWMHTLFTYSFVTKETSPRGWEEGWWVDSFVCVPSHLAFEAQSYLLHLASAFLCIILSSTVSYT